MLANISVHIGTRGDLASQDLQCPYQTQLGKTMKQVKYVIYIQCGPSSKQQKSLEHSLMESVLAFVSNVSVEGTNTTGRLGIPLLTWEETTLQVQVVGSTHFTQHCS